MFEVVIRKKVIKQIEKTPKNVRLLFYDLVEDLKKDGAIQKKWPNFSKLSKNTYHCHLNYSYVACWKQENNTIKIEVYYAGSRENAPY